MKASILNIALIALFLSSGVWAQEQRTHDNANPKLYTTEQAPGDKPNPAARSKTCGCSRIIWENGKKWCENWDCPCPGVTDPACPWGGSLRKK